MSIRGPVSHKNISNDNFGDEVQKVISARGIEDVGEVRFSDSGFYSVLGTSTLSSDRTITLPNVSGTVALTSQIVDPSGFVDLTTDQTIGGIKTFSSGVQVSSGNISLTAGSGSIHTRNGSAGNPSLSFQNDQNTGLYRVAEDNIGFACGGIREMDLNSSRLSLAGNLVFENSSFSNELLSDTLTGNRLITLPNSSGTVALLSNIPSLTNYVDLTTNQTITGQKVFGTAPEFPSGIFNNTISFLPDSSGGFLLATKGSYGSYISQGLSLTGPQTITNGAYLAGSTLNCDNSTYTDSATAASGVVAQVSDVLIGQRTYNASNTGVVYTSAASLRIRGPPIQGTNLTITTPNALQVDSGNVRLTNGRVLSTALGTAALPAFAIGTLLNDGIYSSAAGNVNISAGGTLRATFTTASLTFASNYGVSCSGTATVTSGSGGFTSAGPVSSSLASSAAACAVRPTNAANTGIFGTASTACNIAVGGTAILSCSTSGASVTGTFSASGVSTLSSGVNTLLIRPISGNTSTVCPTTNLATGTSELLITPSSAGWTSGGTSRTLFGDSSHSIEAVNGTGMTIYDVNKILFTSVGPYNFIDNGSTTMLTYGSTSTDPIANNAYGLNFGSASAGSSLNIFSNVSHVVKIGRSNDGDAVRFYRNNPALNVVGSIALTAAGTTYNTTSDRRLKQDITEKKDSLATLKQIKIYDYKFKADSEKQKYCGVLADEIRSIMPEVVFGKDDKFDEYGNIEPLMVDYSRMIPYLIGAIQELVSEIEDLKKNK